MKLFCSYLRARLGALALFLAFWAIFILMAKLGGMAEDNIRYAAALCALIGAAFMVFDGARFRRRHLLLRELAARTMLAEDNLPESANLLERDYEALVRALQQERAELVSAQDQKLRDMDAYYTLWAHQIKTPIAAMRCCCCSSGTTPPTSRSRRSSSPSSSTSKWRCSTSASAAARPTSSSAAARSTTLCARRCAGMRRSSSAKSWLCATSPAVRGGYSAAYPPADSPRRRGGFPIPRITPVPVL
jgi:hypothetical protein